MALLHSGHEGEFCRPVFTTEEELVSMEGVWLAASSLFSQVRAFTAKSHAWLEGVPSFGCLTSASFSYCSLVFPWPPCALGSHFLGCPCQTKSSNVASQVGPNQTKSPLMWLRWGPHPDHESSNVASLGLL